MATYGRLHINKWIKHQMGVRIKSKVGSWLWQLRKKISARNNLTYNIILKDHVGLRTTKRRLREFFLVKNKLDLTSFHIASVVDTGRFVANGQQTKVAKYTTIYFGKDETTNSYGMTSNATNAVNLKAQLINETTENTFVFKVCASKTLIVVTYLVKDTVGCSKVYYHGKG